METSATSATHKTLLQRAMPYLLIAPSLLLIFTFTIWPSIQTVNDSLYEPGRSTRDETGRRVTGELTFVGLENYADLFDEAHPLGGRFAAVLVNTIVFTAGTVLIGLPLALLLALLINRNIRGLAFLRFSFFYPVLLPLIGAANIWAFMYANTTGLINTVLTSFGLDSVDWLGQPDLVLISVIVVNIWKQAGFFMIFYLAGLQGISRDIYEAADLDGASYFEQLAYITLPLLRRTTLFIVVVSATFAFQTVEQLEALNRGQPADRANLLLYFIFQNIGSARNLGYINAMTVILVGILLVFTVSNFLLFERGGREDE
jgi:sn-glycerol 3-phosphate transport system permease protein